MQVVVRENNVEQALRALKKKMQREGIFREMKARRSYEKPSEKRARQKAEAVRRSRKLARKQAQREGLLPMKKKPAAPDWRWSPGRAPANRLRLKNYPFDMQKGGLRGRLFVLAHERRTNLRRSVPIVCAGRARASSRRSSRVRRLVAAVLSRRADPGMRPRNRRFYS